jgi:hypothetical protein
MKDKAFVFKAEEGCFREVVPNDLPKYSGLPFLVCQENLGSYENRQSFCRFYSPSGVEIKTVFGYLETREGVKKFEAELQEMVNLIGEMSSYNSLD